MIDLPPVEPVSNVVTYEMIQRVSRITKTPVLGLYLILRVENGIIGECNRTNDCGPFQVNKQHYQELREYGLTEHAIINNALANALAAGIILRQKLNSCANKGYDWFGKIACYHNFKDRYRNAYRQRLIRYAQDILPPPTLVKYRYEPPKNVT